jgi:hypothetical protein
VETRTNNDQLFADLKALTEEQIEVGLAAGVWGDPLRPLVQNYLLQMKLKRIEEDAAAQLDAVRAVGGVARLAVDEASRAKLRATAAMILAAGAMVAAMAAAFIAFLALRKYGFEPPW